MQQQTARGANGAERGALAGDLAAERIMTRLREMMAQPIGGFGPTIVTMADLGLTTRRDGSFAFDRAQFDRVFDRSPALFDAAFSDRLASDTPGITLSGTPPASAAFGTHEFLRPAGSGPATISGRFAASVDLGDGTSQFVAFGGDLAGVTITARNGIERATLSHAFGFSTLLGRGLQDLLQSNGTLAAREAKLATQLSEQQVEKDAITARSTALETRYSKQFTAMEIAVTQLKGTGQFLTNLIEQWNNAGK
jgi:flagellar hook-associated protein 2